LKLSFGVLTLPQTFLIKDGMAYEMQTLAIFYDNVRAFINDGYLSEKMVY